MPFYTICRKEFEPWKGRYGWTVHDFCPDCFEKKWSKEGLNLKGIDTYCIKCGEVLEKTKRKNRGGQIIFTSANKRYCNKCRELKKAATIRKCVVCGSVIKGRAHKYCDNCKPNLKSNPNPIANRKSSIKWAKNNPEKVKASVKARYKYYKVNIIYECPCAVDEKHNHHFDYNRPFDVIRLCPRCHALEHARLRNLKKQSTSPPNGATVPTEATGVRG